ncbi:MAG: hypothetical protein HKO92_04300, partial [Flavobacteriaceae bacterium]|nr:hypothetical protein [Flavobacteriaceae bacterium]
MKKYIYLFMTVLFITSCSEKDMEYNNLNYDSTKYVVFASGELSVNELVNEPIEIEVLYAVAGDIGNVSIP